MENFKNENRINGSDVEKIYKKVEADNKKGSFFVDVSQKADCAHNDIHENAARFFQEATNGRVDSQKYAEDMKTLQEITKGLI